MTRGSRRVIPGARGTTVVSLPGVALLCAALLGVAMPGVALAGGQTGPAERPPMAEEVFKNLQVLKGIPVNQFMETMGFFTASVGVDCTFCHATESGGSWDKYADDNAHKRTARRMVLMVTAINRDNFGGRRVVTCYTCHRGGNRPRVTPSLAALYGASPPDEANDEVAVAPGAPSADQVLDTYIQALGGAPRLAGLTSFVAKGTFQGYEDTEKHPVEVFARAPGQRATIVHAADGDSSTTYDGRTGWIAASYSQQPVPVLALSGGDLEGARMDGELSFPARIKQAFSDWRVGVPATIDDRAVQVLQGTSAGRVLTTFYFDAESGLLLRLVRYTDSPVGRIPTQIDYADYREVSGVKMPFRWTVTWLDGRSTFELSEVRPNAPIDAATFGRPAQPTSGQRK
jgi:photosynthetic reaction center cytochrome c subunit